MNPRSFFFLAAVVLAAVLLTGTVSAAKITMSNGNVDAVGKETTVHLVLDEAPAGFAGYFINVTLDPRIARITKVSFPAWAAMNSANGLAEGKEIQISAIDLTKTVQSGSRNIELATITVQGVHQGSTILHLQKEIIDDDYGHQIKPAFVDGTVMVGDGPPVMGTIVPISNIQISKTLPVPVTSPNPQTVSSAPGPTPKVTYVATGEMVPVVGIILSIIIFTGGYLRRR